MPIKAIYEALIRDGLVHVTTKAPNALAAILTNLEPASPGDGPGWNLPLTIGEGPSARLVDITLAPIVSRETHERSFHEPVFAISEKPDVTGTLRQIEVLALFRDRLFRIDHQKVRPEPLSISEIEEVKLRVKRAVYAEEEELNSIKSYVANVEAAREYQKSGPRRDPIPSDVRMLVWSRDGGACTACGARERLHFDHIIPVAKGGGTSADNIQILCETCNLKKSDKIA